MQPALSPSYSLATSRSVWKRGIRHIAGIAEQQPIYMGGSISTIPTMSRFQHLRTTTSIGCDYTFSHYFTKWLNNILHFCCGIKVDS